MSIFHCHVGPIAKQLQHYNLTYPSVDVNVDTSVINNIDVYYHHYYDYQIQCINT